MMVILSFGTLQLSLRKKQALEDYAPLDEGKEAHWEVVERILFLYAKLNPGTINTYLNAIYRLLSYEGKWLRVF